MARKANLYWEVRPPVLALKVFIIQGLDLCAAGHTLKWE